MEYVAHPREKLKQLPVKRQLSGWGVVQVHRWAYGEVDTRCGCLADTRLGSSLFSSPLLPPLIGNGRICRDSPELTFFILG